MNGVINLVNFNLGKIVPKVPGYASYMRKLQEGGEQICI